MQIIKDQQITTNEWSHIDDTMELPSGKVTVPCHRWLEQRQSLLNRGDIGLRLSATDDLETIKDDLSNFEIIAIEFNKFNDGRGYTHARMLRERYGYKGEIRAVGNFLQDQIYYLTRCGFNAFEFQPDHDLEKALPAFSAFSVTSQPDVFKDQTGIGPWR